VVDYCYIALQGKGQITVCDAPLQSADFGPICRHAKLDELCDLYKREAHFEVEIVDLRKVVCSRRSPTEKHEQGGDPNGYAIIDLGSASCHAGRNVDYNRYRVTDYNPTFMQQYHNTINHKYFISKTLLSADVVVNLPKLKTHRKAGLTCALKNMIGMNCIKDALPHHTAGSKEENGDEYLHKNVNKKLSSFLEDFTYRRELSNRFLLRAISAVRDTNSLILKFTAKDPFFEGSWYGNDTIWRTVLDLNRILYYADKSGVMRDSAQRTAFILVDAIVAGEREGPLEPTSKECGVLIAGLNPVAADCAAAGIMGFDYQKITHIAKSFSLNEYPLMAVPSDRIVIFDNGTRTDCQGIAERNYGFVPSKGWETTLRNSKMSTSDCQAVKLGG
jgi:hypothetical protein